MINKGDIMADNFTGILGDRYGNVGIGQSVSEIEAQFVITKSPEETDSSSAHIDLKIGPYQAGSVVDSNALSAIKDLVHTWLSDHGCDTWNGIPLRSITIKPLDGSTEFWVATCEYSVVSWSTDTDFQFYNFQISVNSRTAHITQSLQTTSCLPTQHNSTGFVKDFGGSIGYNEGAWDGCDIVTPMIAFSQDKWYPLGGVSMGMIRNFAKAFGHVNSTNFYGFSPGEVLCTGITNGERVAIKSKTGTSWYWKFTFNFEACPSEEISIDGSNVFLKRGYDYVWTLREKRTITDNDNVNRVIDVPVQVNNEVVYYPYDFNTLGLNEVMA